MIRRMRKADLPAVARLAAQLVRLHHGWDAQRFFMTEDPEGGYRLVKPADQITVGEVLKFVEDGKKTKRASPDAFTDMWKRVDAAVSSIVDRTTFAELVRRWKESQRRYLPNWQI